MTVFNICSCQQRQKSKENFTESHCHDLIFYFYVATSVLVISMGISDNKASWLSICQMSEDLRS